MLLPRYHQRPAPVGYGVDIVGSLDRMTGALGSITGEQQSLATTTARITSSMTRGRAPASRHRRSLFPHLDNNIPLTHHDRAQPRTNNNSYARLHDRETHPGCIKAALSHPGLYPRVCRPPRLSRLPALQHDITSSHSPSRIQLFPKTDHDYHAREHDDLRLHV